MPPFILTRIDHGVEAVLQRSDDLDRLMQMRDQNRESYKGWAGFAFGVTDEADPERGDAGWCDAGTHPVFEGEDCVVCQQDGEER